MRRKRIFKKNEWIYNEIFGDHWDPEFRMKSKELNLIYFKLIKKNYVQWCAYYAGNRPV